MSQALDLTNDGLYLRRRELELLEAAREGTVPAAEKVVQVIERLGRARFFERFSPDAAWEVDYKVACDVIEDLLRERDELADRLERSKAKALERGEKLHEARSRLIEFERVLAERDEFRQAARDADARYFALLRRNGHELVP